MGALRVDDDAILKSFLLSYHADDAERYAFILSATFSQPTGRHYDYHACRRAYEYAELIAYLQPPAPSFLSSSRPRPRHLDIRIYDYLRQKFSFHDILSRAWPRDDADALSLF